VVGWWLGVGSVVLGVGSDTATVSTAVQPVITLWSVVCGVVCSVFFVGCDALAAAQAESQAWLGLAVPRTNCTLGLHLDFYFILVGADADGTEALSPSHSSPSVSPGHGATVFLRAPQCVH
jgi:hypothetical protein